MIGAKGLFGRRQPWQTPGIGDGLPNASMPQNMGVQDANFGGGGARGKPRSFWQGGDKFTGRDAIAGALAAIGDGLSGWAGGPIGAVGNLLGGREEAAMLAERQRQQAMQMSAAQSMGIDPQQAALLGPEGLRQITVDRLKPKEPQAPRFEQDGAGNVWALDPMTGQKLSDKPAFVDQTERIVNWNGSMVRIPNPFATSASQGAAPDRLPPNFFDGEGPERPNAMTAPAPRVTGARMISPQEYQRQLREFGGDQTSMNAWMRANNVLVGN